MARVVLSTALTLNEASSARSYSPGDIVYVPGAEEEYMYAQSYSAGAHAARVGQPGLWDSVNKRFKVTATATIERNTCETGFAQAAITNLYYGLWLIKGDMALVYKEGAAVVAWQPFVINSAATGSYYVIDNFGPNSGISRRHIGHILSASAGKMTAKAGTKGAAAGSAKIHAYGW